MLPRPILKHYTATRSDLVERATAVFALVSTGRLKLRIESSYSLADAGQAHCDLNGRKTTGKLLLPSVEDPICTQIRKQQRRIFTVSEMWTSPRA